MQERGVVGGTTAKLTDGVTPLIGILHPLPYIPAHVIQTQPIGQPAPRTMKTQTGCST